MEVWIILFVVVIIIPMFISWLVLRDGKTDNVLNKKEKMSQFSDVASIVQPGTLFTLNLGCIVGKYRKAFVGGAEVTTKYRPFTIDIEPTTFNGFDDPNRRERFETFYCPFCHQELKFKIRQITLLPMTGEEVLRNAVLNRKVMTALFSDDAFAYILLALIFPIGAYFALRYLPSLSKTLIIL